MPGEERPARARPRPAVPFSRLGLTLQTARHLQPAQLLSRTRFVAERALVRARPGVLRDRYAGQLQAIAPRVVDSGPLWAWPPAPFDPAARADLDAARAVLRWRFTFLNQPRRLHQPIDWFPRDTSRLWRFQLHAFPYAVDLAAAQRSGVDGAYEQLRSLVQQWLAANPIGATDAWHPFVVSGRAVAWQVARDLLRPWLERDERFEAALAAALLQHAAFLAEHLETDVGGNHLLKNLVALLLIGCAFEGPAPAHWRATAGRLLEAQLGHQVLADGGHYERSPMYHLLVLADLLVALRAAGKRELSVSVPLADAVRRMQRFASTLRHPDGDIPLFNDSVLDEAPAPPVLLGPRTESAGPALRESGYFLMPVDDPSPGGVLIADCGPPGPPELPAHVHADALSFELSLGDRRVLVDGGVLNYEPGRMRGYFRGTAAHNTLQVDALDQSEVWSVFRVARRADVRLERWAEDADGAVLLGSHDGYARVGVRHQREIRSTRGHGWRVTDTLYGQGVHSLVSRLRLDARLTWRPDGDDYLAVDAEGEPLLRVCPFGAETVEVERGVYSPRFNQPRDVQVLALRRTCSLPAVTGYWLLFPGVESAVV